MTPFLLAASTPLPHSCFKNWPRKCSSRTADLNIGASAATKSAPKRLSRNTHSTPTPSCRRASVVPHLHCSQCFSQDQGRIQQPFVSQFLPCRYDLLLVGLVVVLVASLLRISYLPQRLGPAASTWMTDVDFLVHLHILVIQVLPFRPLDAFKKA